MEAREAVSVDLSGAATADEGFPRAAAETTGFGSFAAPAGTMAVKWQVLLNASGLPTGSIVVDAASLALAGE